MKSGKALILTAAFIMILVFESNIALKPWIMKEKWIPHIPKNMQILIKNYGKTVNVKIILPHGGFKVHWGNAYRVNGVIYANVRIVMWTGITIPVVTTYSYNYTFHELEPGRYEFTLVINGEPIKTVEILIGK